MSKNKGFSDTSANRYSLALYELAKDTNSLVNVEINAKAFGVSVAEYLRHLAMNDISEKKEFQALKNWEESLPSFKATDKKWKEWDESSAEEGIIMSSDSLDKMLENV